MWKLLALCLVLGLCHAEEEYTRDEEVLVLTTENFDSALEKFPSILVEFYAPWCGHCKALAPEYAKAAQALKDEGSEIQLGKVDATEQKELGERFGVRGYPTLKFFMNGKPVEYNGPRKAEGIVSWLTKKTGFPATKLTTVEEAEKYLADRAVGIIGFFESEETDSAKAFIDAVRGDDEFQYAFTSEQAVFDKYEVTAKEHVALFKKFDEGRNDYEGDFTTDSIVEFVQGNSLPLFVEFTQETAQRIFAGKIKYHVLLFASRKADTYQAYNDTMVDLAKGYRGRVVFVLIDADKDENSRIAEFFGLSDKEIPTVRLIDLTKDLKKYKPQKSEVESAVIKEFIEEFLAGNLKPHLLTQDKPEDWDKEPVKVLVGSNFDEVAFDKSKDVLVEFYAPWCGHCKKLAPIYDELAENFKDNDKVVVAKMDSTANELEHTQIQSFPTLKLYKAESNDVVEYNGERTLEGLTKFLESGGEFGRAAPGDDEDWDEEDEEDLDQKDEL